ncbi:hypothetical protein P280DRAFT_301197 [Massarina eburnea CBS 473.64]|uniref:Uncharacterized protein n=1 Tax=Massarina eburnea CBS 473.64 TaxID=1395130 RepID=A0A6A6S4H0_9PLEO|nr:hypothetical protein P280DRAFT_301197 [Massarina eburnea CBS 473.64]
MEFRRQYSIRSAEHDTMCTVTAVSTCWSWWPSGTTVISSKTFRSPRPVNPYRIQTSPWAVSSTAIPSSFRHCSFRSHYGLGIWVCVFNTLVQLMPLHRQDRWSARPRVKQTQLAIVAV